MKGFDKNSAETTGSANDFHGVFYVGKNAEMSEFLFKICQRVRNIVRQTDATARHSNDDKEIICDFV